MAKKNHSEYPYLLEDRTGTIPAACPILALADSFEAVRVVFKELWSDVKVKDHAIVRAHIAKDREASRQENTIYYEVPATEVELKKTIAHLRYMALEYGAAPEAIRLLGSLEPWTKKEEAIMAEKLKSKASAAKPDKEGLKAAAKKAPVAPKGAAPKRKGNADALAKARAAKGPDNRKIKALIKAKDIKARPGTFRHKMVSDLISSKTAQEFRDKDSAYDAGCLRYATEAGIVSLS
jgi:hypothetical protein